MGEDRLSECRIVQGDTPEYLKNPYTKEDFEKDSRAVCVAGDDPDAGMILWWEGAQLDREINEVGQGLTLEGLQLLGAPAGVSIWTGRYVYETFEGENGKEYDYEAVGDFRDLTPVEWLAFAKGENPLDVSESPAGTWASASRSHVIRDIAEVKPLIDAAFGPTVRERLVKLFSEHGQIEIDVDGSMWCAKFADFMNLMESPCGFGDYPEEALKKLYDDVQKHELEGSPKPVGSRGDNEP
jgi:hypothetical protein